MLSRYRTPRNGREYVLTVAEAQKQLHPKQSLAPYAGSWVALRDGAVIASAPNSTALRDNPKVLDTDVLMPAPKHPTGVFLF